MWTRRSFYILSGCALSASAPFISVEDKRKESSVASKLSSAKGRRKADFLIVGGGTTAFAAAKYLKDEADRRTIGSILMVTEENHTPYMKPPLSKQLWASTDDSDFSFTNFSGSKQSIFYKNRDFFNDHLDLKLDCGKRVIKIDPYSKEAHLSSGEVVIYDKCLLATGGVPKDLPVFSENPSPVVQRNHSLFRTVDDFKALKEKLKSCSKVAVVGGGYLGCELSIALASGYDKQSCNVVQIIPESGYMGLVLPNLLSSWIGNKVKKMGVAFRENSRVKSVKPVDGESEQLELELFDGSKLIVDHVIVAVGIEPNVELAESACLELDQKLGGYFVNSELQSSSPDIWVGGDACSFYDTKMNCRRRVEHHDHAVVSGRLAAKNMLRSKETDLTRTAIDAPEPFYHQSMFWGDLGDDYGYEAIGLVDSKLHVKAYFKSKRGLRLIESNTNVDPKMDLSQGVLFYMEPSESDKPDSESKIVGILCWNIFGKMPYARNIIGENFSCSDTDKLIKNFI
ncbi:apoptosis-inducing factor 1, mitochondrial-like isoform X3 [Convolutriloba macropyga]|uniref:apoptosis-inducing factor 1, mitochondrial-like isoform X3 n=1 Tax=Convolutriloba macropyga TaxID=536237 RepID=UPI003F51DE23